MYFPTKNLFIYPKNGANEASIQTDACIDLGAFVFHLPEERFEDAFHARKQEQEGRQRVAINFFP